LNHKPHFDLSLMLKPTLSAPNGPLGEGEKETWQGDYSPCRKSNTPALSEQQRRRW
jgi:hypothetical protein